MYPRLFTNITNEAVLMPYPLYKRTRVIETTNSVIIQCQLFLLTVSCRAVASSYQ